MSSGTCRSRTARLKCVLGGRAGPRAVEAVDDQAAPGGACPAPGWPSGGARREQQPVPLGQRVVGDAHVLAELLLGRLGHADVVAEGLAHLLDAVEPGRIGIVITTWRLAEGAPGSRARA